LEPRVRKTAGGAILLVLAFAMLIGSAGSPLPSANDDVVRAIYIATASILVALAVVLWASE